MFVSKKVNKDTTGVNILKTSNSFIIYKHVHDYTDKQFIYTDKAVYENKHILIHASICFAPYSIDTCIIIMNILIKTRYFNY